MKANNNLWHSDDSARAFWDQHQAIPYQELLEDTIRKAAPKAVVSITFGRSTATPSMSAWNCMSRLFTAAPPSIETVTDPLGRPFLIAVGVGATAILTVIALPA